MRTPLETPNSHMQDIYKHLIYERLFHGWSNAQSLVNYRLRGGMSSTTASVSKSCRLYAPRWFAEEKVVLPWNARGTKEHDRLKKLGLGPENFPLVRALGLAPASAPAQTVAQLDKSSAGQHTARLSENVDKRGAKVHVNQRAPEKIPLNGKPSKPLGLSANGLDQSSVNLNPTMSMDFSPQSDATNSHRGMSNILRAPARNIMVKDVSYNNISEDEASQQNSSEAESDKEYGEDGEERQVPERTEEDTYDEREEERIV
jgi:hypothetical protein